MKRSNDSENGFRSKASKPFRKREAFSKSLEKAKLHPKLKILECAQKSEAFPTFQKKKPLYIFLHIPKCGGTTVNYHIKYNFKEDEAQYLFRYHSYYNILKKEYRSLKPENIKDYLKSLSKRQKDKIKVIYGHDVYYGMHKFFDREARYIMILREPFSRIISLYNQERRSLGLKPNQQIFDGIGTPGSIPNKKPAKKTENKRLSSFKSWLRNTSYRDHLVRFLARRGFIDQIDKLTYRGIKKALKKFYFVGIFENFNEDSLLLYPQLGINKFFTRKNVSKKNFAGKQSKELKEEFLSKNIFDKKLYSYALRFNKNFKSKIKDLPKKIRSLKIKKAINLPLSNTSLLFKIWIKKLPYLLSIKKDENSSLP